MNKRKIFNDPVYGFITIPFDIIFDLIEHPYFQRLRRIKQVSLTHYVYPGALHTRFHHALGALHLMTEATEVLRTKGANITEAEREAVCIAILLHDIGHGPFSHTLENTLVQVHHERMSLAFMEALNEEFGGKLEMAISIFKNTYPKPFLYQLVSGQLDMDRMDYLSRDSFFTGVSEGKIGYDRIIKMLNVRDGELVVEEKAIYSLEKFLMARRLMYWQVYLHKTVLAAELMLISAFKRAKQLVNEQLLSFGASSPLSFFLKSVVDEHYLERNRDEVLKNFARLDDYDIILALKSFVDNSDTILSHLSSGIIDRKLFRIFLQNSTFDSDQIENVRQKVTQHYKIDPSLIDYFVFVGKETNLEYTTTQAEIKVLQKNGEVKPMSTSTDQEINSKSITKYYLSYPKGIQ